MSNILKIKNSVFTKITIIYGAVILLIIPIIMSLVCSKAEKELKMRWQIQNKTVTQIMANYFDDKIKLSYKVYERLFTNRELFDHILSLMKGEQEYDNTNPFEKKFLVEGLESLTAFDDDIVMLSFYRESSDELFVYETFSRTIALKNEFCQNGGELGNKEEHRDIFTYEYSYWNKSMRCIGITYNFIETASNKPLGKVVISYDLDKIKKILREYLNLMNGQILLLKMDGSVVYDSNEIYYGGQYPYYDEIKNSSEAMLDQTYSVSQTELEEEKLKLYSIIPLEELTEITKSIRGWTYTLSILSLTVILLIYVVFNKIFSRRVSHVIKTMECINEGKVDSRIKVNDRDNDEITQISKSFNHMCDRLMMNMQNLLESRERQKHAELEAMQMKMDPHFIYNSLEIIKVRCEENGNEEAADILQTFSELFREAIRGEPVCSIKEELDTVKIYTDVLDMCYNDILKIKYEIEPEILEYGILKKIIQPIVENYFVHGFDKTRSDNEITIQGFFEEKYIIFRVIDNGKGMDKEREKLINRNLQNHGIDAKSYIGLNNANNRIRLLFGPDCGLKIESEEGKKTVVTVKIGACSMKEVEDRYQYSRR